MSSYYITIGQDKLIMGLPLYGRAWADPSPAHAYTYPQIETMLNDRGLLGLRRDQGIPSFEYEIPVLVQGYYEDALSTAPRCGRYSPGRC